MRTWARLIFASSTLCLALGCAAPGTRVPPAPTDDELPSHVEASEPFIQATVAVQGQQAQPQIDLAPSFQEPELTPAERKALGKEEPTYKPLLFPPPGHYHPRWSARGTAASKPAPCPDWRRLFTSPRASH